ncbi:uncharacterized protein LOC132076354 [Ammospiza nelsoni]|uniref:uncharacterized protein LOC132076354 n=1 Tax=Ammospiza nelsoni TaxID=2857394 RepID=UPI00286C071E|nr:uncharacterized protein LOC132076354 [Ammospiza nelsoni]
MGRGSLVRFFVVIKILLPRRAWIGDEGRPPEPGAYAGQRLCRCPRIYVFLHVPETDLLGRSPGQEPECRALRRSSCAAGPAAHRTAAITQLQTPRHINMTSRSLLAAPRGRRLPAVRTVDGGRAAAERRELLQAVEPGPDRGCSMLTQQQAGSLSHCFVPSVPRQCLHHPVHSVLAGMHGLEIHPETKPQWKINVFSKVTDRVMRGSLCS